MEVLGTKNTDACPPSTANLDTYTIQSQELVPVYITEDKVTEIAGHLSRGAGTEGTKLVILQYWLLIFGAANRELWMTVADFAEWIVNGRSPWDAYRALMSGRMIALENNPGVRPVGVGET